MINLYFTDVSFTYPVTVICISLNAPFPFTPCEIPSGIMSVSPFAADSSDLSYKYMLHRLTTHTWYLRDILLPGHPRRLQMRALSCAHDHCLRVTCWLPDARGYRSGDPGAGFSVGRFFNVDMVGFTSILWFVLCKSIVAVCVVQIHSCGLWAKRCVW